MILRLVPVALAALALTGCGAGFPSASNGKLQVVAAENFWGSIAAQLGGDRVQVASIVHSPGADPHAYEPTPADARATAVAKLAIVNGAGYDPWAPKLLDADPVDGRIVLTVADLVHVKSGGNPHRWYSPADVRTVVNAIARDYIRLDPKHAGYFDARRIAFESRGLARYDALLAGIRQRFAGTPVGASESIFAPLAQSLGLRLVTPSGLLNAISEGSEPTAADKSTADSQIARGQIRVWVYNSQNATPDVQRLTDEARAHRIPVVTISETPTPSGASFQDWQARQLEALQGALAQGSRR